MLTASLFASVVSLSLALPPDPPPMLLVNARVLTLDSARPDATAIAIDRGRITAIGDERECRAVLPAGVLVLDCGGRPVTRGFFDAHCHLMSGGIAAGECDLVGCKSLGELYQRVHDHAVAAGPGEWILGRGFDHSLFADEKWPDRSGLDAASGPHPVLIRRVDGHAAVANTHALNLASVDETTPDPPGGVIERGKNGVPNGVLKEGAMGLVDRFVPAPTFEQKKAGAKRGLAAAARVGVTSCVDHGGDPEVYRALLDSGELTARISIWADLVDDLSSAVAARKNLEPVAQWVELRTLKGFVDGTFGSRTAAMFDPFADDPSTTGVLVTDPDVLARRVLAADKAGFQVALHAIGDRAVSIALDCFEKAAAADAPRERRHRIEHVQVMRRADVARMKKLAVTASVQPCHLLTDRRFAVERIGEARARDSYLWKSLFDAGIAVAFGSDYPVEPLDPMRNLFAAVSRGSETDATEPAYHAEECVTLDEALAAETIGGAHACFRENELGALRAGTLADLVVLDRALDQTKPRDLLKDGAWKTIVGGRVVWSAQDASKAKGSR